MSWHLLVRAYGGGDNSRTLTLKKGRSPTTKGPNCTWENGHFLILHPIYILSSLIPLLAMTTLVPRPPYTQDELDRLYPKNLKLQLVQIVRPALFCE